MNNDLIFPSEKFIRDFNISNLYILGICLIL